MPRKPQRKSFLKMSAAERDKDVAKYDAGISFDDTRPLTPAQQGRWERARGRRSKGTAGEKDVPVVIRLDPRLLVKAHEAAQRDGKSLSTLISELLSRS